MSIKFTHGSYAVHLINQKRTKLLIEEKTARKGFLKI